MDINYNFFKSEILAKNNGSICLGEKLYLNYEYDEEEKSYIIELEDRFKKTNFRTSMYTKTMLKYSKKHFLNLLFHFYFYYM